MARSGSPTRLGILWLLRGREAQARAADPRLPRRWPDRRIAWRQRSTNPTASASAPTKELYVWSRRQLRATSGRTTWRRTKLATAGSSTGKAGETPDGSASTSTATSGAAGAWRQEWTACACSTRLARRWAYQLPERCANLGFGGRHRSGCSCRRQVAVRDVRQHPGRRRTAEQGWGGRVFPPQAPPFLSVSWIAPRSECQTLQTWGPGEDLPPAFLHLLPRWVQPPSIVRDAAGDKAILLGRQEQDGAGRSRPPRPSGRARGCRGSPA